MKTAKKYSFASFFAIVIAILIPYAFEIKDAESVSAVGTAKLRVVKSSSLASTRNLDFDKGSYGATPGDPADTIAATDGTYSAGFLVTGPANQNINISIPTSIVMKQGPGLTYTHQILINNFTLYANGSNSTVQTIGTGGTLAINIGASRAGILTNQAVGNYIGYFTLSINY